MTNNHFEPVQSVGRDTTTFKRLALLLCLLMVATCVYYFEILDGNGLSQSETELLSASEAKSIGDEFYFAEQFAQALPYYFIAVEKAPDNTEYLRRLGNTHSQLNQFKRAEQVLNRAIVLDKGILAKPTGLAEDWFYLGRLYRRNSMYQDAHDSVAKSLDIAYNSNLPPEYHVRYRVDLAVNRIWRGHFDQALEHIEKAFDKARLITDKGSKDVAALYAARGIYYRRTAQYDKAVEDFNQALKMNISYYGVEHSKVARQRSNLGNVYTLKGDNAKALTQFKTALAVLVKVYGQSHQTVSAVHNNIAKVLMEQGNYAEAEQSLAKAMLVDESLDNGVNRYKMHTLLSMAEVKLYRKQLDDADKYLNQSLNMCLQLFGHNHHVTAYIWQVKGDLEVKRWRYDEAKLQYGKAYKIYVKLLGEAHQDTKAVQDKIDALEKAPF